MIDAIRADPLSIRFRQSFGHASAVRSATQTIWVTATGGGFTGSGEGCPREYVTGESIATAQAFVAKHAGQWKTAIHSFADLSQWVAANEGEIDANPSAWCAVELSLLDLFAKARAVSVESLLDLPPLAGRFRYTAVIGDAPAQDFERQVRRYQAAAFRSYK